MLERKHAKSIKLFLMDADPNGRVMCELSNWNGKAYKVPRSKIKDCANRPELRSTAVYMLFGNADSSDEKPKIYIGEAENVYDRLGTHVKEKEFWKDAVIFISKDDNLNKAHIKYLESRLCAIAQEVSRHTLENKNSPTQSSISEADQAEMEEFIEYVRVLVNVLGYRAFEPLRSATQSQTENPTLFIKAAKGANASGIRTTEGFVVYKDSTAATSTSASFPPGVTKLREALLDEGVIQDSEGALTFNEDYLFNSPSAAAAVVLGRSANGLTEWKDKAGRVLKSIEENELSEC